MVELKLIRILGIETSCDETAAAVIENGRALLGSTVATQMDIHARYGGVFPRSPRVSMCFRLSRWSKMRYPKRISRLVILTRSRSRADPVWRVR